MVPSRVSTLACSPPFFSLPVMAHTLRSLREGYYSADSDVGKMFLSLVDGRNAETVCRSGHHARERPAKLESNLKDNTLLQALLLFHLFLYHR
mmetsp:Transcript_20853/g.29869  ORF Transcript_20853/g.29869 Transcript_20853/m.29869 type:complete len:93 (+) Transcript_20853:154-432(+)